MGLTVKVNGSMNGLVHKGSNHLANSTAPDVCKTPSPAGPVPIPYPVIISKSSDLANGSTTVKADGGNMVAIKDCEYAMCTGDEAGTAGGVVSSTFKKEAKFILFSFDVKIDGKNACRLGDKMTMNHQNTICMAGTMPTPVTVTKLKAELKQIAKKCNAQYETAHYRKTKSCTSRGKKKHKCCENALNDKKATNPKKYKNVQAEHHVTKAGKLSILDVAVVSGKNVTKIFDYKFNCKGPPKMSSEQIKRYTKIANGKPPVLIGG